MQWALAEDVSIVSMQTEANSLEDIFRSLTANAGEEAVKK
jgi:hypothetical protein